MGKITVKHYLNNRAKPGHVTDKGKGTNKETYPVYVQIIYKRHSTNKKSDTEIQSTIEGFEHYKKTGQILESEFFTSLSVGYTLEMEKLVITNSIKLVEKFDLPFSTEDLLNIINYFSKSVHECLNIQLEQDISVREFVAEEETKINSGYREFILSFNDEFGKIGSLENIKKYTNVDLLKFVKLEDIAKLKAVNIIARYFHYVSFAEFYFLDYYSIMRERFKLETVEAFEELIKIIDELATKYAKSSGYIKIFGR